MVSEYYMTENFGASAFRATLESQASAGPSGWLRGEVPVEETLRFRWIGGGKAPLDLIWTDGASILVSDRFRGSVQGLTGWDFHAVSLVGRALEKIDGYSLFIVTGRCGPFLPERCRVLPKTDTRLAEMYQGLYFAIDPTHAGDFSMPDVKMNQVLLSSDAVRALRSLQLANVHLLPCAEVLIEPLGYEVIMEKYGLRMSRTN
jgi:hypothetical protein